VAEEVVEVRGLTHQGTRAVPPRIIAILLSGSSPD